MRGLIFTLARVTVEAATPLTVGSGENDDLLDAIFVTDANGLPTIPGSSLAGVLRHAVDQGQDPHHPESRSAKWFGFQEKDRGAPSRVEVSWAQVHDEKNCPVPFRGHPGTGAVMERLKIGITRDHVCLSERGVVAGRGKFDETLIPKGARFTFELLIHAGKEGEDSDDQVLNTLLGLLKGGLRVGGRTRRGFGELKLVTVLVRKFDIRKSEDRTVLARLPVALDQSVPKELLPEKKLDTIQARSADQLITATLTLQPQDYWLFGGGQNAEKEGHSTKRKARIKVEDTSKDRNPNGKDADRFQDEITDSPLAMIPWTEPVIQWNNNHAVLTNKSQEPYVFVASGLKGAIRHRVLFHHRRLTRTWADQLSEARWVAGNMDLVAEEPSIKELFGAVSNKSNSEETGIPGRVFVSDVYLENTCKPGLLQHVSIDRFTSGPMDGMLFGEAPLFRGPEVQLKIQVSTHGNVPNETRKAFAAALGDLCEGRLALGAGSARGHGYFTGSITWSDNGNWIGGKS